MTEPSFDAPPSYSSRYAVESAITRSYRSRSSATSSSVVIRSIRRKPWSANAATCSVVASTSYAVVVTDTDGILTTDGRSRLGEHLERPRRRVVRHHHARRHVADVAPVVRHADRHPDDVARPHHVRLVADAVLERALDQVQQ